MAGGLSAGFVLVEGFAQGGAGVSRADRLVCCPVDQHLEEE